MNELEQKVLTVFSKVFNISVENLSLTFTKDDIDSWDSLGQLQLIMSFESEFDIKFKTQEINQITSIQKSIDYIKHLTDVSSNNVN
ncbi:MAG: acyl carrier protein [Bacteroidetes bacterium]|nr:acyl carrier protein [Bacteroidota bacterium]